MGAGVMDILANYDPNRLAFANQQRRGALQQQAVQTQGLQAENATRGLQNQVLQQQIDDNRKVSEAYRAAYGSAQPDEDPSVTSSRIRGELLNRGVSTPALLNWQQHDLDIRKKAADLSKEDNEQYATNLKNVGSTLGEISQLPQEQRPAALQTAMPALRRWEPKYNWSTMGTDDASLMNHAGTASYVAGIHKTQADTQKQEAETNEIKQKTVAAKRTEALQDLSSVTDAPSFADWRQRYPDAAKELPPLYSAGAIASKVRGTIPAKEQPEFDLKTAQATALKAFQSQDPKQVDALVDQIVPSKDPMNESTKVLLRSASARGATMPDINQILKDAYDQRGRVQVAKESAQNRMNINLGGMLGGAGGSALAKAVSEYDVPFAQAIARLPGPARESLMAEVKQLNPDFKAENYDNFRKTEMDATTGKIGTSANALNTMMGHLSVLNSAADALKNGDVQAINKIANMVGAHLGQTPKTTYETIVHRLGPEVTKAYLASGGSVGERGTNEEDFSSNLSPDQIKQNIGVSALLADSKIKALQDQYQRGTYGRGKQKLMSDEAEQARQGLTKQAPANLQGGKIRARDPQGKLHEAPAGTALPAGWKLE